MGGYRFLEHTSDIRVEAWGSTLEEAFSYATKAFYDIILDIDKVETKEVIKLDAEGFDLESLLFNWIDLLIQVFEIDGFVISKPLIKIHKKDGEYRLEAECWGERYKREKHGYKVHVKAITYHEMIVKKINSRYVIRYIVDI